MAADRGAYACSQVLTLRMLVRRVEGIAFADAATYVTSHIAMTTDPLESHARTRSASQYLRSGSRRSTLIAERPLFDSFFLAGFECSDHRREDGCRLDMLRSTRHDTFAAQDYERVVTSGMTACRDGVSWVRVEPRPGVFVFSDFRRRYRAVPERLTVIWDLMHFGSPDHVDVFAVDFPDRFTAYARAVARFMAGEGGGPAPMFSLINEMSFLSWAGGDVACLNPFCVARGDELKVQLVLATIGAIEAIREIIPGARFVHAEPIIHIVAPPENPKVWRKVECDNAYQFEALEMLSGNCWPRLGGNAKYLDIVGINFYPDNQFTPDGDTISRGDPRYRPFSTMLVESWRRFQRPLLITETGAEAGARAPWLRYVADECLIALDAGCELHGLTWYPILNHPGWLDDRHCQNGLWDYASDAGQRVVCEPLLGEMQLQAPRLEAARARMLARSARERTVEPVDG
jgi:hypothetical protein